MWLYTSCKPHKNNEYLYNESKKEFTKSDKLMVPGLTSLQKLFQSSASHSSFPEKLVSIKADGFKS